MAQKQIIITFSSPEFQEMVEQCLLKVLQSQNKVISAEEKEFINRTDAAKLLKISLPSLTKFSKPKEQGGLGILKAHRLGNGTIRYCKQEILQALTEIDKTKHSRRRDY